MSGTALRPVYIEGRFLAQNLSGIQRYGREMTRALDRLKGSGEIGGDYVLLRPPGAPPLGLSHIEERQIGRGGGHAWSQTHFAWAARSGVALSLAAAGPLLHPRHLVVIHDAAVFRHPAFYSRLYGTSHRFMDRVLARTARLATVSEFSRGELADVLHLTPDRIAVFPNGVEHLRIAPDAEVVRRLGLSDVPFFLILGSLTANKNLKVAVEAAARLTGRAIRLVAVGGLDAATFGQAMPEAGGVVMLPGRLSDAEVAGLMGVARALIFPSIYEGFGIPPLEAMVNDCPVLASTAPAVRETCGDAAVYFEPHDAAALTRLMEQALNDDGAWRAARVAAGREQVKRYSWRTSAARLAAACETLQAV